MVTIHRHERPCPCGSGQPYGDCCAPQTKHKRRRRKKKDARRSRRGQQAGQKQRRSASDEDLLRHARFAALFNTFIERIALVVNTNVDIEREQFDDLALNYVLEHLEVTAESRRADRHQSMMITTFAAFRQPRSDKQHHKLVRRVKKKRAGAQTVFEQMKDARLGLWKVERLDGQLVARLVGAQAEPIQVETVADSTWQPIDGQGRFIGWQADLEGYRALFFAERAHPEAADKIERAARRRAWGADEFRGRDYEEDVIALALDPGCVDTGRDEGRVFLSSIVEDDWVLPIDRMTENVRDMIVFGGLDGPIDEAIDRYDDAAWYNRRRRYSYYYDPPALPSWTLQAARATGVRSRQMLELLEAYRDYAVPRRARMAAPIGDKTCEYVLPTAEILSWMGLDEAGDVDHPTARQARSFALSVLDVDAAALQKAGFDLQWSIDQALAWAKNNADDALVDQIEAALADHEIACRWVGVVARASDDSPLGPVRFDELRGGIAELLPARVDDLMLDELDIAGRGTVTRLQRALRTHGALDDDKALRLGDLPLSDEDLLAIDGVGQTSVDYLHDALLQFVGEWPASAGQVNAAPSAHLADQANAELAKGLDELDELF